MSLSYSQIASWNRCRKQWYYHYHEGLSLRVDRPKPTMGTIMHIGLAALMLDRDPEAAILAKTREIYKNELSPEEQTELQLMVATAGSVLHRLGPKLRAQWEPIAVEAPFRATVAGEPFVGYVDLIARDLINGGVWLLDWKIRESFMPDSYEEYNLQMAIYQKLLQDQKMEIAGSIQYQIKPIIPREPTENKDGSLSRARIITDWPTYKAAILKRGFKIEDYAEMEEKLADVEFTRITREFRSPMMAESVWGDVVRASRDITTHTSLGVYRSLSPMVCSGCDFRDLCMEELRGADTTFLLQTRYKMRGEAPFVVPELDEGDKPNA